MTLLNVGTAAEKSAASNPEGEFSFVNLNPGKYTLTVTANGFDRAAYPDSIDLQARETRRVDAAMKLGAATETVTVQGGSTGVITTDVSNLSESKTGRELTELPVAVYSRSTGSTSPIDTLTTLPGVQVDDSNNMVINGTTPALMSYTHRRHQQRFGREQWPNQRAVPVFQLDLRDRGKRQAITMPSSAASPT